MQNVISTTVTSTVVLGSGNYSDRIVVTAGGAVEPIAYGAIGILARASIGTAHIFNQGTIMGGPGANEYGNESPGGIGVDIASAGALMNTGTIEGGQGVGNGYGNGLGGVGVLIGGPAQLNNHGVIAGGAGYASSAYYGQGGGGGAGVILQSAISGANHGTILGGNGGNGYNSTYAVGGQGGAGLIVANNAHFVNDGLIAGGAAGVAGQSDQTSGGGYGVRLAGARGSLDNAGRIVGGAGGGYYAAANGIGVSLGTVGTLHNTGVILGGAGHLSSLNGDGGIGVLMAAGGTIDNRGTIGGGQGSSRPGGNYIGNGGIGAFAYGGLLSNGGTITGGEGGTGTQISGGIGVTTFATAEIRNAGRISGGDALGKVGGVGIHLVGSGSLVNSGEITGGSGIGHRAFRGAAGAAAVFIQGGAVSDSGIITGGSGASGTHGGNGGAGVVLDGATLTVSGSVDGGAGASGPASAGLGGAAVQFMASGNLLVIDPAATLLGGLAGFATGDTVDLAQVRATSLAYAGGTLTLFGASHQAVAQLAFDGSYTAADFALSSDGHGGTDIQYNGPGAAVAQDYLPRTLADFAPTNAAHHALHAASIREPDVAPVPQTRAGGGQAHGGSLLDHGWAFPQIEHGHLRLLA